MMSKIKVLHLLNTSSYSGAENVAITLILGVSNDVDSLYVSKDGPIKDYLERYGIKNMLFDKIDIKSIRLAIRSFRPDIIHAHDFTMGVLASISNNKIPIISHLHNNASWIKHYSIKTFVYFFSTFRYRKILTVSASVMDDFVFGDRLLKKTNVVGNPINTQAIIMGAHKAAFRRPSDIMFLGRLSNEKNPITFVRIIRKVVDVLECNIKAFMVGEGELRNEVIAEIQKNNLENTIELLGFVDNPYGLLSETKILCMPSTWEGFGLAAIEALALGKPVVAANVGGLKDIVTPDSGYLCSSLETYAEAIIELLSDETKYKQKSTAAKGVAEALENLTQYCANIVLIYQSALEK